MKKNLFNRYDIILEIVAGYHVNRRFFLKFGASSLALGSTELLMAMPETDLDVYIKDQLELDHEQCKTFAQNAMHKKPVIASLDESILLTNLTLKLKQTQRYVGYAKFNLLCFDEFLYISKNNPKIGELSKAELEYIEKIFYTQASDYGFYGKKVTFKLSDKISNTEIYKVPYTGHYLYKDEPLKLYERLKKEIGPSIVLTSGVRSVVKQLDLFLYKVKSLNGNYSLASNSLAPAGYSFHGVSDFDVGKVGYGYKNFTSDFAGTAEYKDLQKLGYINIRYPENNPFGVRFEPWHIKV